jgi:hypothetical protein
MWCSPVKFGGDSGCGAASIGYRGRIRKGFRSQPGHPAVVELLSSEKFHCRPASALRPGRCRRLASAWALPRAFTMDLRAACAFLPFARICARSGHLAVVNQKRRAVRFVGWRPLGRVGKAANGMLARGAAAQRLYLEADIAQRAPLRAARCSWTGGSRSCRACCDGTVSARACGSAVGYLVRRNSISFSRTSQRSSKASAAERALTSARQPVQPACRVGGLEQARVA